MLFTERKGLKIPFIKLPSMSFPLPSWFLIADHLRLPLMPHHPPGFPSITFFSLLYQFWFKLLLFGHENKSPEFLTSRGLRCRYPAGVYSKPQQKENTDPQ